jgi:hypothetical protein
MIVILSTLFTPAVSSFFSWGAVSMGVLPTVAVANLLLPVGGFLLRAPLQLANTT